VTCLSTSATKDFPLGGRTPRFSKKKGKGKLTSKCGESPKKRKNGNVHVRYYAEIPCMQQWKRKGFPSEGIRHLECFLRMKKRSSARGYFFTRGEGVSSVIGKGETEAARR